MSRCLGRSAVEITRLGFGGAPLGNLFSVVSERAAEEALETAWDAGWRYFDTAPLYGHGLGEQRIGRFLRGKPRNAYRLSTKIGRLLVPQSGKVDGGAYVEVPNAVPVYDYSRDGALRSVEESLARLGLDRIDILLIHDIDRFTHKEDQPRRFREAMDGAYPALADLRARGVVGAIGLGVNDWRVCEDFARIADVDCFLLAGRYTLLEQEPLTSLFPLCIGKNISVIAGGVFNSGILATGPRPGAFYNYHPAPPAILERATRLDHICQAHGVALAAAALQFPLAHPAVAGAVVGARKGEEVRSGQALLDRAIPAAFWTDLKAQRLIAADAPTP
ncbi:MAG: aldo/keto reductase [Alphaproteobacteria bacterium]|nr:aldo/keto reductase [Alphaproteobacteria bacterium]